VKGARLSGRQAQFVHEYLIDQNGTQAAIRAGYSRRGADVAAFRLLRNPRIARTIQMARDRRAIRTEVTADRALAECALIAFSDVGDVLDFTGTEPRLRPAHEIPPYARRAISSVKVKRYVEGHGDDARTVEVTEFKFWSKDAALEKLFKHFGLFGDEKPADLAGLLAVLGGNGKPNGPGNGAERPRIYDA